MIAGLLIASALLFWMGWTHPTGDLNGDRWPENLAAGSVLAAIPLVIAGIASAL